MKTKLSHDEFLTLIAPFLGYKPDSANYALYEAFIDCLLADGGDDDFAKTDPYFMAFVFSSIVFPRHIEDYDNEVDNYKIYIDIKKLIMELLRLRHDTTYNFFEKQETLFNQVITL